MQKANLSTQESMKNVMCSDPNCTSKHPVLYMSPSCHEGAGLEAQYNKEDGVLTLSCQECDKVQGAFLIAPGLT
jgi:hypothetical protein